MRSGDSQGKETIYTLVHLCLSLYHMWIEQQLRCVVWGPKKTACPIQNPLKNLVL